MRVFCDYCHDLAEFAGGKWHCYGCRAWVNACPKSPVHKPMGRLAKHALRVLHVRAWFEFRDVWRADDSRWPEEERRKKAHLWLARELGLYPPHCNIGFFDEAMTQRVIDICSAVGAKKEAA